MYDVLVGAATHRAYVARHASTRISRIIKFSLFIEAKYILKEAYQVYVIDYYPDCAAVAVPKTLRTWYCTKNWETHASTMYMQKRA